MNMYEIQIYCFFKAAKKAGIKDDVIKKALGQAKEQAIADRLQAYTDEAFKLGVTCFFCLQYKRSYTNV